MNNKETYGVDLEVTTKSFKEKIKESINQITTLQKKASENFKIGLDVWQTKKDFDSLKSKIEKSLNEKYKIKANFVPELGKGTANVKNQGEKLSGTKLDTGDKERLKDLQKMANQISVVNTLFGNLGAQVGLLKTTLDSVGNKVASIRDTTSTWKQAIQAVVGLKFKNIEEVDSLKNKIRESREHTKALKKELQQTDVKDVSGMKKLLAQIKESKEETKKLKKELDDIKPKGKLGSFFDKIKDKVKGTGKSANDLGSNISKAFSNGIKSVKRFAIALLGVRGVYGILRKAVSSYLSTNTQISDQLNAMFAGLGQMLGPVIDYVIGLFSKLLAYVNAFIKTLTGIDMFAKGVQASANKATKATEKMKGSLAAIDEITNLDSNSGGSGGSGGVAGLPEVDIGPLMNVFDQVKDIMSELFQPFIDAWEIAGETFLNSFYSMFEGIGELVETVFGSVFEVFTNGTGAEIIANYLTIFSLIFDVVGGIASSLAEAWKQAGVGTAIVQNLADIFKKIQEFAISIMETLKKWVISQDFQDCLGVVLGLIRDITGAIEEVAGWVLDMWNKYVKPVVEEKILPAISSIVKDLGDLWNKTIKPIAEKIWNIVKTFLEPVIKGFCNTIGGIAEAFKGIIKFVTGVFTGDWSKAWDGIKAIFQGFCDAIGGIFSVPINLMIQLFESFINFFIDGWNFLLKCLNKISISIPDWVPVIGGSTWGFDFKMAEHVTLPRLETGTNYVPADMMAILHKGESVVPKKFNSDEYFNKNGNEETNELLRELIEVIDEKDMNTYLDGDEIGDAVSRYQERQKRIMGGDYA